MIDALAFDDDVLIRWDQQRAARQVAALVMANLIRMWLVAPGVAALVPTRAHQDGGQDQ